MGSMQRFAPIAGRTSPAIQVLGLHELDETLARLSGEIAGPAMRSGLSAAATVTKKVIRANVNAYPILYAQEGGVKKGHPASIKRAARQTLGHSIKKDRTQGYLLRVGFGVGKRGDRRNKRQSRGTTKGKGISARNIHWWILGTRSAKRPGDIRAQFAKILEMSVAASRTTALHVLRQKVWERVRILSARRRRKAWGRAIRGLLRF